MLNTLQAACLCLCRGWDAEFHVWMRGGVGGDEVVVIITADCPDLAHHHLAPPTHNLQITENTTRRQQRRFNYQHILLQSSAILRLRSELWPLLLMTNIPGTLMLMVAPNHKYKEVLPWHGVLLAVISSLPADRLVGQRNAAGELNMGSSYFLVC